MRWRLLILMVPLVGGGCQSPCPWVRAPQWRCYNRNLDDFVACKVAKDVARKQMATIYTKDCWPSCDFQAGFEEAFVDVAMGSEGLIPAVAPPAYWKTCNRTAEGQERAADWLSGYTEGASRALDCRGSYNRVMPSGFPCPSQPRCSGPTGCQIQSQPQQQQLLQPQQQQ